MGVGHAEGESEVGVGEVEAALAVLPGLLQEARRRNAVEHPARRDERPLLGGVLDRPSEPPVPAPRQEVLLGLFAVDGVPVGPQVLVGADAEADQDLVTPGPDTVVRRPTGKPPGLVVDHDVPR